jgi:lauroyl/myristoyl acyltransferase
VSVAVPSTSPKLLAPSDVYQIPVWALTKAIYSLAPISVQLRYANFRGIVASHRSPIRAEISAALERHVGEGRTARDLRVVARRYFQYRCRGRVATLWPQIRELSGSDVEIAGAHWLDEALSGGKGAIVVTAHYGHTRLLKPILRAHGYDALLVGHGRSNAPPEVFTRLGQFVHTRLLRLPSRADERRKRTIGADLPAALNLRPHLAALRRNQVLIILADGYAARALTPIPVVGITAHFASGAVSLARTTGAPAVPAFVVDEPWRRQPHGLRLVVHPPLELQMTDDPKADHEVSLRRFAAVYEEQILAHPQNCHWIWVRQGAFKMRHRGEPFVDPFRTFVTATVPQGSTVLVVSRGYDALLELDGLGARHFPLDAGYEPVDGADAIRQVEAQRRLGGTHIAFPEHELWWLDHYVGLGEYLARYGEPARSSAGVVYPLLPQGS